MTRRGGNIESHDEPEPDRDDVGDLRRIDPAMVIRPGSLDPRLLLGTWFLRRTWVPLLVLGMSVAAGLTRQPPGFDLASPADVVRAVVSPWAGVALAVIVRVLAGLLALALALPLTGWPKREDYPHGRLAGELRRWRDRWYRAGAYRSIRWTWPVRRTAAERLGRTAGWLEAMDRAWSIATGVAIVMLLLSTAVFAGGQSVDLGSP